MHGRERILKALAHEKTDCLPWMPITMMFAADNAGLKYLDYATDYRVLAEAQVRVAEDYDIDQVSVISDPGREASDCGAIVQYFDNQPPAIDESRARLGDKAELLTLPMPDPLGGGRMHDRVRGVEALKSRVLDDRLVEGWVEGPCAEASDLRGINTFMMDLYEDPAFARDLLAFTTELALRFGRAQIQAGADIIGVGDAAASLIGPQLYDEFVWPQQCALIRGLREAGASVRLHVCGNTTSILDGMGKTGSAMIDLDSPVSMAAARAAMGDEQVLLGNIDPVRVLRDGSPRDVSNAIAACHRDAGARYIVGAGCEVPRGTPPENLRAMHEYARGHQLS